MLREKGSFLLFLPFSFLFFQIFNGPPLLEVGAKAEVAAAHLNKAAYAADTGCSRTFYTRVECVVSMFPPFHMDLFMAGNLARCCQSWTFSCLLFRFHCSEPRCLCAGGMTSSAVTTYHQQKAELARSHKMPGPLTRTRKLIFCLLTKSWPPQTPFHPTLVPQFPVPTEPCTRDWLAVHHRLSHWRLRRYE